MGPMSFPIASFVKYMFYDIIDGPDDERSTTMQIELPLWYKRGNLWSVEIIAPSKEFVRL